MAMTFVAEPSNERRATFLSNYRRLQDRPHRGADCRSPDTTALPAGYALMSIKDRSKLDGPAIKHALENNDRLLRRGGHLQERLLLDRCQVEKYNLAQKLPDSPIQL